MSGNEVPRPNECGGKVGPCLNHGDKYPLALSAVRLPLGERTRL